MSTRESAHTNAAAAEGAHTTTMQHSTETNPHNNESKHTWCCSTLLQQRGAHNNDVDARIRTHDSEITQMLQAQTRQAERVRYSHQRLEQKHILRHHNDVAPGRPDILVPGCKYFSTRLHTAIYVSATTTTLRLADALASVFVFLYQ